MCLLPGLWVVGVGAFFWVGYKNVSLLLFGGGGRFKHTGRVHVQHRVSVAACVVVVACAAS